MEVTKNRDRQTHKYSQLKFGEMTESIEKKNNSFNKQYWKNWISVSKK